MRILGIDPGYGLVGFGVVDFIIPNQFTYVTHGSIKTDKDAIFSDRLLEIGVDIDSVIKAYNPTILVIEKLFFAKNITTAMQVSEARGVILYECRKSGLDTIEVTPLQAKSALTGNGKATKTEVKTMVQKFLKIEKLKGVDDAIDALAIAIAGATMKIS